MVYWPCFRLSRKRDEKTAAKIRYNNRFAVIIPQLQVHADLHAANAA